MATTAVTPAKLSGHNVQSSDITFTAASTAADGFLVDMSNCKDYKTVFIFQNTNASTTARTATIKAGEGIQSIADIAVGSIAAGKFSAIVVDSGIAKFVSGTDKGKIKVTIAEW